MLCDAGRLVVIAPFPPSRRCSARFTLPVVFRLCLRCGERNIVRDGVLVCVVCDAELPEEWNFAGG